MEIQTPNEIRYNQVQIIKDHLNLVFNKVTPNDKYRVGVSRDELYNKLFTAHTGITSVGLC